MKLFFIVSSLFLLFTAQGSPCRAQNAANTASVIDSTPIQDLDYRLSKDEFMNYYGTDDTARAIINMFYRKRGLAGVDFVLLPLGSSIVGGGIEVVGAVAALTTNTVTALALVAAGGIISYVGFFGFPIYYIVERSTYSRQKLIYALVGRERGQGIPYNVLAHLKESDFR